MTDFTETRTINFCSTCGSALLSDGNACSDCGAPVASENIVNEDNQPASRYRKTDKKSSVWCFMSGVVVVIVIALLVKWLPSIMALNGPTARDLASSRLNSPNRDFSEDQFEIVRKGKCTLLDLDQYRGYSQRWIVAYRIKGSTNGYTIDAFVYDGIKWEIYRGDFSQGGCPDVEFTGTP